jgi:hypothetical protein
VIGSRRTKRFVIAFAIAALSVAVAIAVRSIGSSEPTVTSDPSAPSSSAPATSTTVASSTSATTVVPTTVAPTSTLPAIGTLPVLDVAAECVATAGEGATPIESDQGPPSACRTADGEERPFDADSACEARYGSGQLSVKVTTDDGGVWKCRVADRIELGQPDWQGHCEQAYGDDAVAFLYQSNSSGWACATVRNGIYLEEIAFLDQACHVRYGTETFGISAKVEEGGTPDDNICYGAAP